MGQGYLVPDYPLTQAVLSSGRPCALTLSDDDVDPAEASVLRELGFASLLMLPLPIGGGHLGSRRGVPRRAAPVRRGRPARGGEILARTSARASFEATTSAEQPATSAQSGSSTPRSCGWEVSISIGGQASSPSDAAPSSAPIERSASTVRTSRRPGLPACDPVELTQLLERVDAHVRVGADAEPDAAVQEPLDRQEAVAEIRLGRRARADARPAWPSRSSSRPSACVACTTVVRGPRQPQSASSSIGRMPCSARHSSISRGCSSACTCSGRPSAAA